MHSTLGSADGALQQKREGQGTRRFWVEDSDLTSIKRLTVLFAIAQELGWVGQGEMEFMEFVALAERARTYGTQSKGGMFYRLVRNRNYRAFITQEQEDRARCLIQEYRERRQTQPKPRSCPGPTLSKDTQIVQVITEKLTRAGFTGDIFSELTRQCPDWTRERWDRATIELERFRLMQRQRALGPRAADVDVLRDYRPDEAA